MEKEKPAPTRYQKIVGNIIWVVLGLVIALVTYSVTRSPDDSKTGEVEVQTFTKYQALEDSHQFIEDRLVAPGSAKWADYNEDMVDQLNDTTFQITSHVDSQNKFGALLRLRYRCLITYNRPINKVLCDNIEVKE